MVKEVLGALNCQHGGVRYEVIPLQLDLSYWKTACVAHLLMFEVFPYTFACENRCSWIAPLDLVAIHGKFCGVQMVINACRM